MWIVRLALRRPYTFVVMALLILILGPLVIYNTPTDVFPDINIPVISVVWSYTGLSADEMASRIVVSYERGLTATVNDIEHIESQSLNGAGASHGHLASRGPNRPAGNHSPIHHHLRRVLGAHPPIGAVWKKSLRAAVE